MKKIKIAEKRIKIDLNESRRRYHSNFALAQL